MKIALFLRNGVVDESIATKVEELRKGNNVVFCNGSYPMYFKTSCDKIVVDEPYSHVIGWAKEEKIPFEIIGKEKPVEEKVESAELESVTEQAVEPVVEQVVEPEVHEVPTSIPAGIYVDPDGVEHDHKGRGYKKELRTAIETHGIEKVVLKAE